MYRVPVTYEGNYLTPTDEYTAEELVQWGRAKRVFLDEVGVSGIEWVSRPRPSGRALEYLTEKEIWKNLKDRRWMAAKY